MIGIVALDHSLPFAEAIRDRLAAEGADVWLGRDFSDPRWPLTEIAIDVVAPCGEPEMAAAPQLYALISPFLGYDFIDVAAATRRGIVVFNGDVSENRESMAEAAIMLILASLYRLRQAEDSLRHNKGRTDLPLARMLKGKTLGLLGSGGIARAVVDRVQPWGCRILLHSQSGAVVSGTEAVGLDALLEESHVVLVATSLSPASHGVLDAARLAKMRRDAIVVNISRGAIIEETALAKAVEEQAIAGAALDVFEVEPLPQESPLRQLPNLILTPHAIGHTGEGIQAMVDRAVANALAISKGELPPSCLNPAVANGWQPARRSG